MAENKYKKTFDKLKEESRIAFVPFWMIGDPTIEKSTEIIKKLAENSDILELGLPFSDPLADGPVIQESVNNALKSGSTTAKCFDVLREVRNDWPNKPIGLLVYFNLIISYGIEPFLKKCRELEIDSILIPELPVEEIESKIDESDSVKKLASKYKIDLIFLVSSNTPENRRKNIFKNAGGFIYTVSKPTITGASSVMKNSTLQMVQNLKKETNIPICVGFGISSPEHIKQLAISGADGAIIGSKLIKIFRESGLEAVTDFCKDCLKSTKK